MSNVQGCKHRIRYRTCGHQSEVENLEDRLLLATDLFEYSSIAASDADEPTSVIAADFDNDGDNDLVVASRADNRIGLYSFHSPSGGLSPQQIVSSAMLQPKHLEDADVDGDGNIDIIAASENRIGWFRNLGNNQFSEFNPVSPQQSPVDMLFANDIDGDGDTDVFSASEDSGDVTWHENVGMSFQSRTIPTGFLGLKDVIATDMDDDGDQDLVTVSTNSATISWFVNDANSFATQTVIDVAWPRLNNDNHVTLVADDLDRDGNMDIVASIGREVSWYKQAAIQEFPRTELFTPFASNIYSIDTADFDNDGDSDIAFSTDGNLRQVGWLELEDTQPETTHWATDRSIGSHVAVIDQVVAVDMDHDGLVDIASISSQRNEVGWNRNQIADDNASGVLSPFRNASRGATQANVIRAGDIDGDGDQDLVASTRNDGGLGWYTNTDGNGKFSRRSLIDRSVPTEDATTWDIQLADLDGNKTLDVIWGRGGSLFWYSNSGNGSFGEPLEIADSRDFSWHLDVGDIDDDGDLDIVVTTRTGIQFQGPARVLVNTDGRGNFESAFETAPVRQALLADLDLDGDSDLVTSGSRVFSYRNDNGVFLDPQPTSATATLPSIRAVDVDSDGDLDLIAEAGARSFLQINTPNGFESHRLDFALPDERRFEVFDVNLDGRQDIVYGQHNGIAWRAGLDEVGQFGPEETLHSDANSNSALVAVDVDNDGDLDLISSSIIDDTFALHRNLHAEGVGDINHDRVISADDIDALYAAIRIDRTTVRQDLNQDRLVDQQDVFHLVGDILGTTVGDIDLDGVFGSHDLVLAFQVATYETGVEASWETGDWNGDQVFDSSDIILAFQRGRYSPR